MSIRHIKLHTYAELRCKGFTINPDGSLQRDTLHVSLDMFKYLGKTMTVHERLYISYYGNPYYKVDNMPWYWYLPLVASRNISTYLYKIYEKDDQ